MGFPDVKGTEMQSRDVLRASVGAKMGFPDVKGTEMDPDVLEVGVPVLLRWASPT